MTRKQNVNNDLFSTNLVWQNMCLPCKHFIFSGMSPGLNDLHLSMSPSLTSCPVPAGLQDSLRSLW